MELFLIFFEVSKNNPTPPEEAKTFLAAKVTNYIEAGLPIIVGELTEHMANLVKEHDIGPVITFEDLKKFKRGYRTNKLF